MESDKIITSTDVVNDVHNQIAELEQRLAAANASIAKLEEENLLLKKGIDNAEDTLILMSILNRKENVKQ